MFPSTPEPVTKLFAGCLEQYTEKSIDLISQAVSVVEPTIVILLSLLVGLVLLSVMMPLLGILSDFAI